ncbi:hypothetical protein [uncultured Clostridium sp.]|uniref:hypothetical protein n=1 Tax=uncultured Clostridium sp. TaxID=59620 RepID=UPI0025E5DC46|nr:hypothetical protein [uncultured Clostridium sp.]
MKKNKDIKISICKKIALSLLVVFSLSLTLIYFMNNTNNTSSKVLLEGNSSSEDDINIGGLKLKAKLIKLSNLNTGSGDKTVIQGKDSDGEYYDEDLTMNLSKKDLKEENGGGKVQAEYSIGLKENPVSNGGVKVGKDVAILVDLDMGSKLGSEATSDILNGFVDRIFNSSDFEINDGSINFCVIPYNASDVKELIDPNTPGNNPREKLHRSLLYCKENMINHSNYIDKSVGHGIDAGLSKAFSFFETKDADSCKMIIIVSKLREDDNEQSDVKLNEYSSIVSDFNNKEIDYSAITIGLSYIGYDQSQNFDKDYKSNLYTLHKALNGDDYAYHVSNPDNTGQSPHHDIYNGDFDIENKGVIQKAGEDIKGYFNNRSISRTTDLYFNMGDYIEPVNPDKDGNKNPHKYVISAPKMTFEYDYSIDENKNIVLSKNEQEDILKRIIENKENAKTILYDNFNEKFKSIKGISNLDTICNNISDKMIGSVTSNVTKQVSQLSISNKISSTILKNVQNYTVEQILNMSADGIIDNGTEEGIKIEGGEKIKLIIKDYLKHDFQTIVNDEVSSNLSEKYKNTIHYIYDGDKTVSFEIKPIAGISNLIEGLDECPYIRFMDNNRDEDRNLSKLDYESDDDCKPENLDTRYNYTYYDALKKSDGKIKTEINSIPVLGIAVSSIEVTHGVYKGIKYNSEEEVYVADLEKDSHSLASNGDSSNGGVGLNFARGSTITFAANIIGMNSATDIELKVNHYLDICQEPKVYKINSDGSMTLLEGAGLTKTASKNNSSGSVDVYAMNFDGTSANDIVILYSAKFNPNDSDSVYDSIIKAKIEKQIRGHGTVSMEYPATSRIYFSENKSLPELF